MTKTFAFAMPLLAIVMMAPVLANGHRPAAAATRQAARADSPFPADLKSSLDKVLESYRKIIILLSDYNALSAEERSKCVDVGRRINQEKQQLLEDLTRNLTAELRRAAASPFQEKPANVDRFISYTGGSALRDVDRLAFQDLAVQLLTVAGEAEHSASSRKSATHWALEKLNDELKSIQDTYQKEVSQVFSNPETRGKQPRREKWQDYITFLKRLFTRHQVLSEYERPRAEREK